MQDTAYGSLLKQERRALHLLVGDALEQLYPDRQGDLAAVLARHYELAGETDKATRYLMEAAIYAYDRNAIVEAFELYTRAEALLPAPSADDAPALRRRRVEIGLGKGKAGFSFMSEDKLLAGLDPIVEEAESLGDLALIAGAHISRALLLQFRGEQPDTNPALRHSLERVEEVGRELNDPFMAAMPQSIVGLSLVFRGHLREGVQVLSAVAPLLEQTHNFVGSSFALVALAIGYSRLGDFDKAEKAAQRATEIAESGDLIAKLDSLIGESTVRSLRGDLEGAIPLAMKCTTMSEETGATACVIASNFVLGDAYMRQGSFPEAKIAFDRGSEVANAIEQRTFRPSIAAYTRSNSASMGDFGPNAHTFDEALAEARSVGDRWGEANVIWKRAETEAKKLAHERDEEHMLADFAAATTGFEMMGARPFLARALRDWGLVLRSIGRADEGDENLRRALPMFEEMGIEREGRELKEELAARS